MDSTSDPQTTVLTYLPGTLSHNLWDSTELSYRFKNSVVRVTGEVEDLTSCGLLKSSVTLRLEPLVLPSGSLFVVVGKTGVTTFVGNT